LDAIHERELRDLVEQPLHGLLHGGVRDAGVRLEDDLRLVARLRRELLLQQVQAVLRLRSRKGEILRVLPAGGRSQHQESGERDDPDGEHPPAPAIGPARDPIEHD